VRHPETAAPARSQGFTLIELMIVIAIIAIIAAIAIPNLIEARKGGNESAAIGTLRTIHTAQTMFRDRDMDRNSQHDYANSLGHLGLLQLIDSTLSTGIRQGYVFEMYIPSDPLVTFACVAYPQSQGKSGDRSFFIDETGVIRASTSGLANDTSEAIGR